MVDRVRIVHVSDPHLAAGYPFRFSYLANKRIIGYANLVLKRRKQHKRRLAFALCDAVREKKPDHLLVTGDLSNIALDEEFALAAHWLERFGLPPDRVTVLPGNHDAYIPSVWKRATFVRFFDSYLPPEASSSWPWGCFPVLHSCGPVKIFGLTSSVPAPPLAAWGRLGRAQLDRLEQQLEENRGAFRVVALHHPVQEDATRWDNRLIDAPALRRILARVGAELVCTGHLHRPFEESVAGPSQSRIPVLAVGSASLGGDVAERRAQFRVVDVMHTDSGWTLSQELWVHDARQGRFVRFDSDIVPSEGRGES